MKELLKKLLIQAVLDYAEKTFTFDNLKLVRDRLLSLLKEQVEGTDTVIDDWGYDMLARMLADDNLEKIYHYVKMYAGELFNPTICKADPKHTLGALAYEMDFTADSSQVACAMPATLKLVQILEIIVPILYDWFKKK